MRTLSAALLAVCSLTAATSAWAQKQYVTAAEVFGGAKIYLQSANKAFYAPVRSDGRLCVYKDTPPAVTNQVWCSGPATTNALYFGVISPDGKLCVTTDRTKPAAGPWCSTASTGAADGQFYAIQQDDGNLCVYRGTGPADNKGRVWCHDNLAAAAPKPPAVTAPTPAAPTPRPPPAMVAAIDARPGIGVGQGLGVNQYLVSPSKTFFAMQQSDGNFCVYRGSGPNDKKIDVWCHQKVGSGGQFVTGLQPDGSLCTYRGTPAQPQAGATWCSPGKGHPGMYRLAQQDDGNLCVYYRDPKTPGAEESVWCHNAPIPPLPPPPVVFTPKAYLTAGESLTTGQYLVSPNKQFVAIQQNDGNFCVYRGTAQQFQSLLWCNYKTAPGGQYVATMQKDGNFCTYRGTTTQYQGGAMWCSNAVAPGGQFVLVQQDDGNLCVYSGTPTQYTKNLWCHGTNVVQAAAPRTPAPGGSAPGGVMPGGDSAIITVNGTNTAMWVTVYKVFGAGVSSIVLSGCVRVGQEASWTVENAQRLTYEVRAEMTSTADCSALPNNRHVVCDTRHTPTSFNSNYDYWLATLRANPNTCWWDGATQRKGSR